MSKAPRILNLDTRCRWVATFALWPFYLRGKEPQYPLDMKQVRS